ncbi:hypothetical protein, conserved [Eimeria acervulina]|uniref:Uncharacterized protein n=1 Tax=Eimeria acervulina TaxID=5801 RepID=U6GVH5_EIMAC|nr:hypothetical protein, conserved [Eimeria acervulina]CDI84266.1 hypothetical protein, conserved [Eimeria acervulina]
MPAGSATAVTARAPEVPGSQPEAAPPSPSSATVSSTLTHPQSSPPRQDASPPLRPRVAASGPAQPPATPPSSSGVEFSPPEIPPPPSDGDQTPPPRTSPKGAPPKVPTGVKAALTAVPMPAGSAPAVTAPAPEVPGVSVPSPPMLGRWNDDTTGLALTLSGVSPQTPCSEDGSLFDEIVHGSKPKVWTSSGEGFPSADSSGGAVSEEDDSPPVPESALDSGEDGNSKGDHPAEPPPPSRREGGQKQPADSSSPSGEPFPPPGSQPTPPGEDSPTPEGLPFPEREPQNKKDSDKEDEAEDLIKKLEELLETGESVAASVESDYRDLKLAESVFTRGSQLLEQSSWILPFLDVDHGISANLLSLTSRCEEVCTSLKVSYVRWQQKLCGMGSILTYYSEQVHAGMQARGPPDSGFMSSLQELNSSAKKAQALLETMNSFTGPFEIPFGLRGLLGSIRKQADAAANDVVLAATFCAKSHLSALNEGRPATSEGSAREVDPANPTLLAAASASIQLKALGFAGDPLRDLEDGINDYLGLSSIF